MTAPTSTSASISLRLSCDRMTRGAPHHERRNGHERWSREPAARGRQRPEASARVETHARERAARQESTISPGKGRREEGRTLAGPAHPTSPWPPVGVSAQRPRADLSSGTTGSATDNMERSRGQRASGHVWTFAVWHQHDGGWLGVPLIRISATPRPPGGGIDSR